MRILLFGRNGQVGTAFSQMAGRLGELVAAARADCDLTDESSIRALIGRIEPDAIVNAAAYTAVDKAESDPGACFAVNADAPAIMAAEAARLGIPFLHYSTDYVFDGAKSSAYTEEDTPAPLNVYGASKLRGEQAIAAIGGSFAILRASWVYSNHGHNFFKTMLRLGAERPELRVVDDQTGAPTSALAIAEATARILSERPQFAPGIYHMTAGGATSWRGFADAIFRGAGDVPVPALIPIRTAEYPTPARRPLNSVLSNDKFAQAFGFRLSPWQQQLAQVLEQRAASELLV